MWLRRRQRNAFAFRGTEDAEPITPDEDLRCLLNLSPHIEEERARYDDSAVCAVLETNPSAAAARYEFVKACRGSKQYRGWRQYPLKRAVALGASLEVVRRMAAAHPDAIRERGMPCMSGSHATALHEACKHGASLEVVRFLVNQYPEALDMTTRHRYLPLHIACERGASADVVRLLVQMHPAALDRRNKLGRTPAECALMGEGGTVSEDAMAALAYAPPAKMRVRRSFEGWLRPGWVAGQKDQWKRKSCGGIHQSTMTVQTEVSDDYCA